VTPASFVLGGKTAYPGADHFHFGDLRGAALPSAVAGPLANRRMIGQALAAAFAQFGGAAESWYRRFYTANAMIA